MGQNDFYLVKTSEDGQMTWHRGIHFTSVGETFDYTVRATNDGRCVFAGHGTTKRAGNLDLILVGVEGENPW